MSLLLDARKKSQQGDSSSRVKLSLEEYPNPAADSAVIAPMEVQRNAGQNLFNAKSAPSTMGANKNVLIALAATIGLLLLGVGYFWYVDSINPIPPVRQSIAPPAPSFITPAATSATSQPIARITDVAEPAPITVSPPEKIAPRRAADHRVRIIAAPDLPTTPPRNTIQIEQQQIDVIAPLLNRAYLAYQNGKLDEAQQYYLDALAKDERNIDALSGLAVIAQQNDNAALAAQYFSRILALDPRNAIANAGMSALIADDNNESRLKTLLHEQKNSAALHFALGNLYADQSRWDEAQQEYFSAYTLNENNAELAFNLAISLEHLGQHKLAAQYYQNALQLDQPPTAGFDHSQIEQRIQQLSR